jgi:hypothetical protein
VNLVLLGGTCRARVNFPGDFDPRAAAILNRVISISKAPSLRRTSPHRVLFLANLHHDAMTPGLGWRHLMTEVATKHILLA